MSQIHDDRETLQERQHEGYDVVRLQWQGAGEFHSMSPNQHSRWNADNNTGEDGYV
jgi:putative transposase